MNEHVYTTQGDDGRPAELVIQNALYNCLPKIRRAEEVAEKIRQAGHEATLPTDSLAEGVARAMLCAISHETSMSLVLKLLASVGGPSDLASVTQMLQAARERQSPTIKAGAGAGS